ncbi:MAG: amino acid permease [Acidobacteriota bacterium]
MHSVEGNSSSPAENTATVHTLPRVLGPWQATAIVAGTIIGSGIFLVPREMMRAAGSSNLVYLAWIAAGILSLFGAMTYAELAAMRPFAGGEYVYLRDAYGELPSFLYMWTWFAVAKPASIASSAIGLVRVLGIFPLLTWLGNPLLLHPFRLEWGQIIAIAVVWLITGLNYLGLRRAGEFQLIFTLLKVALIAAIVFFCFNSSLGHRGNLSTIFPGATGGLAGFTVAMIAALWAYDGWNDLNMVAGEIKHPGRSIPLALVAGVLLVALLYMLTTAATGYLLPAAAIANSPRPTADAMLLAVGAWGAGLVSVGMAISILASLNGTVLSGARIPFAAARDGIFFRAMAYIHPRFESPSVSLNVQAAMSTVLLLMVGKFQALFELALLGEWLFYMLTATTVFAFRRREPERERPYRVPLYPILPAVFVAAAALVIVYIFLSNLHNSIGGVIVIALGLPMYVWMRHRRSNNGAVVRDV